MIYNTIVVALKYSNDIPSGDITVGVVIGTTTNLPIVPASSIVSSFSASSNGKSCTVSSYNLACSGITFTKSKEEKIAFRAAYGSASKLTNFGQAYLKVGGTTCIYGTPSLRTTFLTPMTNNSPQHPDNADLGTWTTSAFGSYEVSDTVLDAYTAA